MSSGGAKATIDIHLHHPDGRTTPIRMDRARLVFGRDADCDVVLNDPLASRKHADIYRTENGDLWVEDRNSKNGTTLNDAPLRDPARLREGDRVGIGRCYMVVRHHAAPAVVMEEASTTVVTESVWTANQQLQLSKTRLERLYELNERLSGLFERDELLREVVNVCIESLGLERAGLALWAGDPTPPRWVVIRTLKPEAGGELRLSRTLVERALRNVERILVSDMARDMPVPTESILHNNIRSAMVVPLVYHNTVHGVLYGDRVSSTGGYNKEDLDFFAALGRLAAMGLVNAQLLEEKTARRHMENQLQLARQIQVRLFPSEPLSLPGLEIDAYNEPGRMVSGDYYDFNLRPDGLITVVIADVSGKGVPAALLMANLQAAVHVLLAEGTDLARAMQRLNLLIHQNVDTERFITGQFGLLDPASRKFRFVNVGHPLPYQVLPNGTVHRLPESSSLPLGVERDVSYEVVDFTVEPGGTLVMYTDGVPDACNDRDESFGDARLEEMLRSAAGDSPRDLITRARRTLAQFSRHTTQVDDITMIAARVS